MGYRYFSPSERAGESEFRVIEIVGHERRDRGRIYSQTLLVDNQWETLRFVQEHMDDFVKNALGVRKMKEQDRRILEESARMFEENLNALFTIITDGQQKNLLEKLSASLKKALLLMAMERYRCDTESVCKALGISGDRLERELISCGVSRMKKAA